MTETMMYTADKAALTACEMTAAGRAAVPSKRECTFPSERKVAKNATVATTIVMRTHNLLRNIPENNPMKMNKKPKIAGINAVLCDDPVRM